MYAPLTSMFLHRDWSHLLGNMLALLVFGIILERRIGAARFLAIYFLAHFVASMVDLAIRTGSWESAYGASAAIAGLAGACFMRYPTAKAPLSFLLFLILPWIGLAILFLVPMPIVTAYGIYLLISIGLPAFAFVLAPFAMAPLWLFVLPWILFHVGFSLFVMGLGIIPVGWWAHISGFVAGMWLILLLRLKEPGEEVKPREEIPAIH